MIYNLYIFIRNSLEIFRILIKKKYIILYFKTVKSDKPIRTIEISAVCLIRKFC